MDFTKRNMKDIACGRKVFNQPSAQENRKREWKATILTIGLQARG